MKEKRLNKIKRWAKDEVDCVVGDWENAISDGWEKELPSLELVSNTAYYNIVKGTLDAPNNQFDYITEDVRFVGKQVLKEICDKLAAKALAKSLKDQWYRE